MSSSSDVNSLNTIPPSCLIQICEFLGPGSIFVLGRVSKALYIFTRSPSDLAQLGRIFNIPASESVWNSQFRHRVSIRSEYPDCPESTLDLDSCPTSNCIRLGSFPLFRPFENFDTFTFHEGFGALRRNKLLIFNDKLEHVRTVDWTNPILNSLSQGRGSPYICSTQDGAVIFVEPMTGDVVYSFKCEDAKLYSGNYLLTVSKSNISLMEIDFELKQHSILWTKSFELFKDSEFRMRGDYIFHFRESERMVYELTMLNARTGDMLWQKTIKGVKIKASMSLSLVTVWNMYGSGLQIRHFECDSGADYEKDNQLTGHIFRPGGCVTRPLLVGDGFIAATVPFIRSDHKLVVVDFLNGTISKEVVSDLNEHRIGIAFREMPFAPVKIKLFSFQELPDDNVKQTDPRFA